MEQTLTSSEDKIDYGRLKLSDAENEQVENLKKIYALEKADWVLNGIDQNFFRSLSPAIAKNLEDNNVIELIRQLRYYSSLEGQVFLIPIDIQYNKIDTTELDSNGVPTPVTKIVPAGEFEKNVVWKLITNANVGGNYTEGDNNGEIVYLAGTFVLNKGLAQTTYDYSYDGGNVILNIVEINNKGGKTVETRSDQITVETDLKPLIFKNNSFGNSDFVNSKYYLQQQAWLEGKSLDDIDFSANSIQIYQDNLTKNKAGFIQKVNRLIQFRRRSVQLLSNTNSNYRSRASVGDYGYQVGISQQSAISNALVFNEYALRKSCKLFLNGGSKKGANQFTYEIITENITAVNDLDNFVKVMERFLSKWISMLMPKKEETIVSLNYTLPLIKLFTELTPNNNAQQMNNQGSE